MQIPSLTYSLDTGFVLALPLHHGDLELDSAGVSTKFLVLYLLKIMLLLSFGSMAIIIKIMVGGPVHEINTCARTWLKM